MSLANRESFYTYTASNRFDKSPGLRPYAPFPRKLTLQHEPEKITQLSEKEAENNERAIVGIGLPSETDDYTIERKRDGICPCSKNLSMQLAVRWRNLMLTCVPLPAVYISSCALARLMSSCINRSSSIRASFFASAGLDKARRRSSTDSRAFFDELPAVWHCSNFSRVARSLENKRTTSVMNSINISSITLTVSFPGFRSSPKPYIKLFTADIVRNKQKYDVLSTNILWRTDRGDSPACVHAQLHLQCSQPRHSLSYN